MKHLIFPILLFATSFSFTQKIKDKSENYSAPKNSALGLLMDVQEGQEDFLFYNQKHVISIIGCENCKVKARTIFETNPDKVVYLDSSEVLFEKITAGDSSNCFGMSSFFVNNALFVTVKIKWAPIVPITIEFYSEDKKLLIERDFKLKYY
jgi:hypothetical protein